VIGLGFSSFAKLSENCRTFGRQRFCPSIHATSSSLNAGRSRKRCFVFSNTGVVPSIRDLGSIRSIGSS
jgi:hypothetical protein